MIGLSKRKTSRLLNHLAHKRDITITAAKEVVATSPQEEMKRLSDKLEGEMFMPSKYAVIKMLEDLGIAANKRGFATNVSKDSPPHLAIEGEDIKIVFYVKAQKFKMFYRGDVHIFTEHPSMVINELEVLI